MPVTIPVVPVPMGAPGQILLQYDVVDPGMMPNGPPDDPSGGGGPASSTPTHNPSQRVKGGEGG